MSPLWLLAGTALFVTGAAWQDWQTGRVRNVWTVPFLAGFVAYHIGTHTAWLSITGLIGCGLVALLPALQGRFGQGDLKLCVAMGAAMGVVPALFAWCAGMVLAPFMAPWIRRYSAFWGRGEARGLPGAVLVWGPCLGVLLWWGWGRGL